MKKLINDPEKVVDEMIEGLVAASPHLKRLRGFNVIVRADCYKDEARSKVALISGGGSGHEPAHAGFVGKGMLSAAVCGNVFASPNPAQVLAAIRAVTGSAGVLLIVKNYTGDRLNFGIAAELARSEGYKVNIVIVGDDYALAGSEGAGRRGLAGTILVHKIAGAAAEAGSTLDDVTLLAGNIAQTVGTMGVALSPCTVPAAGKPSFQLGANEIELGLGIHGEPGVQKTTLQPVDKLVDQILGQILEKSPIFGDSGEATQTPGPRHVVLLVNNLGGTTNMEMAIASRRAIQFLEKNGLVLERLYSAPLMTALEMAGISFTLLPVTDGYLTYLDAPTTAQGWPNGVNARPNGSAHIDLENAAPGNSPKLTINVHAGHVSSSNDILASDDSIPARISEYIARACQMLINNHVYLNDLDSQVGDGDIGTSLNRAALGVLAELPALPFRDPPSAFKAFASMLQNQLGGTSGPLYTVFFLRLAQALAEEYKNTKDLHSSTVWAQALQAGVEGIMELGDAKIGDCTMLDALIPAVEAVVAAAAKNASLDEILTRAHEAAQKGAETTVELRARRGRASYLGERAQGHVDPGAKAVVLIFQSLLTPPKK